MGLFNFSWFNEFHQCIDDLNELLCMKIGITIQIQQVKTLF